VQTRPTRIDEAYASQHDELVRWARARLGDEGEDVVAQAWLEASRGLGRFRGSTDDLRGWVFTIVRRRAIDVLRRRARGPQLVPLDETLPITVPSAEDEAFAGRLGDEAIGRALRMLPTTQADVIVLRVIGGLDVTQVADILGRTPNAVRILQHRALTRLAEQGEVVRDILSE
jgi:RNA polymerase sigma-70 factor (ECF subfamily)